MTGIAGKSKGCTSCRRRKIKCDLKYPACENCSRFGRICEGYGRYPVFINRTADGLMRRKPLEEAKVSSSSTDEVSIQVADASAFPVQAGSPGLQICCRNLEASRYLSWFWDSFVLARSSKLSQKKHAPHWLHHVRPLMSQQPTLDETLLAISLTRFGRAYGDFAILESGRQVYARALGLLQQSLYNEQQAMLDETLATVGVMILYELFEATSTTPEDWPKHVSGLASLLKARGPQRHRALIPRRLFEQSRYMLMIHCITQRKASIFAEQEWQEEPWNGANKGVEQMIIDSGLKLGGLLETADLILNNESRTDDAAKLLSELAEIFNNVHDLLGQYPFPEKGSPKSASKEHHDSQGMMLAGNALTFPLKIMALGVELTACVTAYVVALRAVDRSVATIPFSALGSRPVSIKTVKQWFNIQRVTLAQDICRLSVSYLSENLGIPKASRVIFPLRLAFEQFKTSDPEYSECRALLQRLEGKGTEYVPALERNECIASRIIHHKSPLYGCKEYS